MRRFKHIAAFALSAIMAVSLSATAFAADTVVMYRGSATKPSSINLTVERGVKLSSVKTDVPWLNPQFVDSYSGEIERIDGNTSPYGGSEIELKASGIGTAKVTYEAGGKSYTKDVTVLPYTNPIKSITVSALNKGKNMASKTNKSNVTTDIKATSTKSSQSVKVTAKTGWKISYIGYTSLSTGQHTMKLYSDTKPTEAKLNIGKVAKKSMGMISVVLVNTKTGGELEMGYYFGEN